MNRRSCWTVEINDDGVVEDTESFTIALNFIPFSPPSATVLQPNASNSTVTIVGKF